MKLILLSVLFLLGSCALFKPKNTNPVKGTIEIHTPYCGGAKPTIEMAKGSLNPYANTVFFVKTHLNNKLKKHTVDQIKTDENGNFELSVPGEGTYFLMHEDKLRSFEEFVKL